MSASNNSQQVKDWRQKTKTRIVEAFGGECAECGYRRTNSALALHHLDPSEKDFSLGSIRANPRSWDKIVVELRKCVMLCHNCHTEVHDGIRMLPTNIRRFNEDFADYKQKLKNEKQTFCLRGGCNNPKESTAKFCSQKCSVANWKENSSPVQWDDYDIVSLLEYKSMNQLGKHLQCSGTAIKKWLKRNNIKMKRKDKILNGWVLDLS